LFAGLDFTFEALAVGLIRLEAGAVVIETALVSFQLLFDVGDMSGKGCDFLRQLSNSVVKVLQSNRVGDVREHGLIGF
jgi:hypothetical protein